MNLCSPFELSTCVYAESLEALCHGTTTVDISLPGPASVSFIVAPFYFLLAHVCFPLHQTSLTDTHRGDVKKVFLLVNFPHPAETVHRSRSTIELSLGRAQLHILIYALFRVRRWTRQWNECLLLAYTAQKQRQNVIKRYTGFSLSPDYSLLHGKYCSAVPPPPD